MIPLKYNAKNLIVRWKNTAMTIFGVALVVLIFTVMMALGNGFTETMKGTGDPMHLMVLRQGAQTETTSFVSEESARIIDSLPGIAKNSKGEALVSRERVVFINQLKRDAQTVSDGSNLIIRGVTGRAFDIHSGIKLVEGRMFRPGLREVITSRNIARRFQDCGLGETLKVGSQEWTVVGLFEAKGSSHGSELWADLRIVQASFFMPDYSSVLVLRARDSESLETLKATISETDPRLKYTVMTAPEYYAAQTSATATQFYSLGIFVSIIMSIGAVFGAMNTMYATVSSRRREIATMRSLGFKRRHIMVSFMLESLFICLIGGVVGILLALPVNGLSTGTTNWNTFVEVAFAFKISPFIAQMGMIFAALMGLIGGFFPALTACRTPITSGLREI